MLDGSLSATSTSAGSLPLAGPAWLKATDRSADRATFNANLAGITREKPMAHWVELFEEASIPCGTINTIGRVFADPQVRHLGIATPVEHPRFGTTQLVISPVNITGSRPCGRKERSRWIMS